MKPAPPCRWAQSKTEVFLTFEVDVQDGERSINVTTDEIHFETHSYECTLRLAHEVEDAKVDITSTKRDVTLTLVKKIPGFWFRLQNEASSVYVRTDWNRWCDEEEKDASDAKSDDENDEDDEADTGDDTGADERETASDLQPKDNSEYLAKAEVSG
jgi:hypothetical protein